MMHVAIISQWYPPEPAQIPETLARGLRDRGHRVTVLTGFPNYPSGEIYPGYKQRAHRAERNDGIHTHRVPLYPSHDNSAVGRIANYVSFSVTSTVASPFLLRDVDVAYVYHPPATAALAAVTRSLLRRKPFLLHVQDLWPDSVREARMVPSGRFERAIEIGLDSWCKLLYRRAGAVVVISEGMKEALIERGVDPRKVTAIYNWADESIFYPREPAAASRRRMGLAGRTTLMYAGNLGEFQNLEVSVQAAARLRNDTNFSLLLVGAGTREQFLREEANRQSATNVEFRGRVPMGEIGELSSSVTAHLVSLVDRPLFAITIPSKTQVALASARPVVVAAPGEVGRLISDAGAGVVADTEGVDSVEAAFRAIVNMDSKELALMAGRARRLYEDLMSEELAIDRLEECLLRLGSGRKAL